MSAESHRNKPEVVQVWAMDHSILVGWIWPQTWAVCGPDGRVCRWPELSRDNFAVCAVLVKRISDNMERAHVVQKSLEVQNT